MKNLSIKVCLLLVCIIGFYACEQEKLQEDIPTEDSDSLSGSGIETIPLSEFKRSEVYSNFQTQVVGDYDPQSSSSGCGGLQIVYNLYGNVYVHEGEAVSAAPIRTYTVGVFNTNMELYDDDYFENLVIIESEESSTAFIVKYKREQERAQQNIHASMMNELPVEVVGVQPIYGSNNLPCGTAYSITVGCSCAGHNVGESCTCVEDHDGTAAAEYNVVTPPCYDYDVQVDCFGVGGSSGGSEGGVEGNPNGSGGISSGQVYIGGDYVVEGGDPTNPNQPWYSPTIEVPPLDDIELITVGQTLIEILELDPESEAAAWLNNSKNFPEVLNINIFLNEHTENNNTDPEAIEFANEIATAGANGTLVSDFPFVKYPEGSSYADDYPKITQYLKQELPKLADDEIIVDALEQYGSLSQQQITEALTWGEESSTTIEIYEYMPFDAWGFHGVALDLDPNIIVINEELENVLNINSISEDALNFFLGIVVLHEITHMGDYLYNGDMYEGEEGNDFELYVTGVQQNDDPQTVYQGYLLKTKED